MKKMPLLLLFLSMILYSCDKSADTRFDDLIPEEANSSQDWIIGYSESSNLGESGKDYDTNRNLNAFKLNFPKEFRLLSMKHTQKVFKNTANKFTAIQTIPVIKNSKVVGRFFDFQSVALYLDFSNYKEHIKVYNIENPSESFEFQMIFNSKTQKYEPVIPSSINWRYTLCVTTCTLGAIAIASSDGPAPVMDVLAISYLASCGAECIADYL